MILVSPKKYKSLTNDDDDEPIETSALEIEVILSAIPKNFRNRAKSILNNIMTDPQHILRWNGRGEIIYNGFTVSGSHITDLLKNSQKSYKHLKPIGQHEFREGLRELNIPLELLESAPPGVPNVIEPMVPNVIEPMVWLRV